MIVCLSLTALSEYPSLRVYVGSRKLVPTHGELALVGAAGNFMNGLVMACEHARPAVHLRTDKL